MCWFSAHELVRTRGAIEGEELIFQDFPETGNRWFASRQESEVAVCVRSGCKLRLNEVPKDLQELLQIGPEAIGEFRESYQPRRFLNRFLPPEHMHDVLVFDGGRYLPVRKLPVGMRIDVLSSVVASPSPEKVRAWENDTSLVPFS